MTSKTAVDRFKARFVGINPDSEYSKRCLECEFIHGKEERTTDNNSELSSLTKLLNSGENSEVIRMGKQIIPKFEDFDLPYIWVASAHRAAKQYSEAKAILVEGLSKSKRKTLILRDMGETELALGNIEDAIYWWCQALVGISLDPVDFVVYLFLSSVAEGVGCGSLSRGFLKRADIINDARIRAHGAICSGHRIRLSPEKADSIIALVSKSNKRDAIYKLLWELVMIYYI